MNELYNRQKELDLSIPQSAAVVGCGGVGAWVALNLALTGVKKIALIDPDRIEEHNLNRTPFCVRHIGVDKVVAISELIFERRNDVYVVPIQKRIEDLNDFEMSEISDAEIVIDCRDVSSTLPSNLESKGIITGGYDGSNITIHINRRSESVWGDGQVTYRTVPSWLVPPQMIAAIIVAYIVMPGIRVDEEKIISFDMKDIIKVIDSRRQI